MPPWEKRKVGPAAQAEGMRPGQVGIRASIVEFFRGTPLGAREKLIALTPRNYGEVPLVMTASQSKYLFLATTVAFPLLAALMGVATWLRRST